MGRKTIEQASEISRVPAIPDSLNIPPCHCGAKAELVHYARTVRDEQIDFYGVRCERGHRIPTAFGYPGGAVKFWSECLNNHR